MKRVTIEIDEDYGLLSYIEVEIDRFNASSKHILMSRRKEENEKSDD